MDILEKSSSYSGNTIFFFKQKTAYEMESRDWSSDVCSSDLNAHFGTLTEGLGSFPFDRPTYLVQSDSR